MDRGTQRATVHRVTKSRGGLECLSWQVCAAQFLGASFHLVLELPSVAIFSALKVHPQEFNSKQNLFDELSQCWFVWKKNVYFTFI